MTELRDEFLSEEDLDLRNLSQEELVATWNEWLRQAQVTNEHDRWSYSHGVFAEEPRSDGDSAALSAEPSLVASLRTTAEGMILALNAGVVAVEVVAAWVDSELIRCDDPPPALIEACWNHGDVDLLIASLRQLPGEPDRVEAARLLRGWMRSALETDPGLVRSLVGRLRHMVIDSEDFDEDARSAIYRLDHELDMIDCGYGGTMAELRADLLRFLTDHGR